MIKFCFFHGIFAGLHAWNNEQLSSCLVFLAIQCVFMFYVPHNIRILLRRQNSSSPCRRVYGAPHCNTGWPHTVRNLFSLNWCETRKDISLCFMNGEQRDTETKIQNIQEFQALNLSYQESEFSEQSMRLCV